jgi:hypothetical protein
LQLYSLPGLKELLAFVQVGPVAEGLNLEEA